MLAVGLGAASAAALPPVFAVPVLALTIPGLLWLIGGARRARGAARAGWLFGLGHHVAGLYWITDAIVLRAADFWWAIPLAVPFLAALLAVFIAIPCGLAWRARPGVSRVLTLAGAWTLGDLAREFVATGFPWNPLGSVWAIPGRLGDIMLQPAAWVGTPGLTLATLVVAGLAGRGRRAWWALAMLALWSGSGIARLTSPLPPPPDLTVVLVQGNIGEEEKLDRARARMQFDRYLSLTNHALAEVEGPAVAVWPESASPYWLLDDTPEDAPYAEAARIAVAAAANRHAVLAGSIATVGGRTFNALVAITPEGKVGGWYAKWHLVPFGEFSPRWFILPFQVVPGGGFAAGPGPRTIRLPGVPSFGPLICYEAVYPGVTVARDRPAWLANITNDAWFGDTAGPRQHLAAARMRAVEEGLPLLRAANTGISVGFDARGHELGRIPWGRAATVSFRLPASLPPTIFGVAGLVFPAFLSLTAIGLGMRPLAWDDDRRPKQNTERPKKIFPVANRRLHC